ncbi:5-dehydro-2-deoxygluconokinase [Angustibacter aerolatus]
MSEQPFDLITMGRIGVDLYPLEAGVPLQHVERFGRFLGGSATNVAVAAARHGRRTAVVTRTGADPFGTFVHEALRDLGVVDRWVTPVAEWPTPITFCEIFPPDDFPIWFYRTPTAPDLQLTPEQVDAAAVASARVLWTTLTGLSQQPSLDAHRFAWRARGRLRHTVIDLDWRPAFWPDVEAGRERALEAVAASTVAVGNRDECEVAVGERDPDAAAEALLALGVELAVVKQGPDGVLARTADERVVVPVHEVEVLNGLGAGDAFGGALVHGLLEGWPLERTLRFANVAGAIVASRLECSTAMPTTAEVEHELGVAA